MQVQLAGCVKAPNSLNPTIQWQHCQVADFSEVRLTIARLRSDIQNGPWKPSAVTLVTIFHSQLEEFDNS